VFKRLGHAITVFALLCAIGAHWVVLQSVAWTTMLAQNLRNTSLSEAVERTFDGEHPCPLCKNIAKGKQAEKKSEFPLALKKFELSLAQHNFTLTLPWRFYLVRAGDAVHHTLTHAPPVPPPRSFLA
jgi:hypothetical protein